MKLEAIGWDRVFASQLQENQFNRDVPGRVARCEREHFLVWTEAGEADATVGGAFRHSETVWPCTGDWVMLRGRSVIVEILRRRTLLARKEPGRRIREQALAANIDVAFVVSGLDLDYNPRRLERYLTLIYESGARPVILLNKADLRSDLPDVLARTGQTAPGVPVLAVSALQNFGLNELAAHIRPGETAALIGSSGAGKSSILNRLLGDDRQQIHEVRNSDSRGRHTTTRRELFVMPGGWLLMDLPGLRELQLWADPEQIDQTFADITDLAAECRFRDCTHQREPGCAVRDADLDPQRLASFHKLQREVAYLDRQLDRNLARETKQRWKSIHKAMRHNPKQ